MPDAKRPRAIPPLTQGSAAHVGAGPRLSVSFIASRDAVMITVGMKPLIEVMGSVGAILPSAVVNITWMAIGAHAVWWNRLRTENADG